MYRCLILTVFLLSSQLLEAQNWNLAYSKEIEAEDFLYDKQYEKAAKKYLEALKVIPNSASLKYKVGSAYLLTPDKKLLALEYLQGAAEGVSASFDPRSIKEVSAPPDALFQLGRVYQMANQFDKAISAYSKYKTFLKPDDPLIKQVDRRIEMCKVAPVMMADEIILKKTNLGNIINSKDASFNAVISGDGNTMAYTKQGARGLDVYISRKQSGAWEKPKKITDDLGAPFLKTTGLSYDGSWLYLVDDMGPKSSIWDTFFEEGYWVSAKKLKKPITSKFSETHAVVSSDGRTLYFTSDRPGGLGGLDIYKSTLDSKERWTEPQNLGPRVNTQYNEDTPFLTPDGRYLFFSSEGWSSMGGFDIFYVDLEGSGEPANLGYPLNNGDDNLFYVPESITRGFMALTADGNYGPQDIFRVEITPLVNLLGTISSDEPSSTGFSNAQVTIVASTDEPKQASVSGDSFVKKVLPGTYSVNVKLEGYEDFSTQLTINDDYSLPSFPLEVKLKSIPKPAEPVLAVVQPTPVVEQKVEETKAEVETPTREVNPVVVEVAEVKTDVVPEKKEEAKAVEPLKEEPKKEEVIKEEPKKEEPAKVEQPKEDPKREVTKPKEPKVENPKPAVIKPEVKAKLTPKPNQTLVAKASEAGKFTVQIMALIVPASTERFSNIEGLTVNRGDDGYYRYTVGATDTREEAQDIQRKLRGLGYTQTFIRRYMPEKEMHAKPVDKDIPSREGNFSIQVFALKNPIDLSKQNASEELFVEHGNDSFYRYFIGNYSTYEQASNDLPRVHRLGYNSAFVKRK